MSLFAPEYYKHFRCTADKCRHSCCVGWEIDIDPDTIEYYGTIGGELGEKLKSKIAYTDDVPHFILDKDERCPFLDSCGLCELITALGEDALCQICDDHPRFRNFYSDRTEIGVGLCCEAAAELILSYKAPFRLECIENYGKECLYPEETELLAVRERIFEILTDRSLPVDARVKNMLDFCDMTMPQKSLSEWSDIYMSLEQLDPVRNIMLSALKTFDEAVLVLPESDDISTAFEQLLCYFIYRHLADSLDDDMLWERVAFCAQSYFIIRSLCAAHYIRTGKLTVNDIAEIARIYSSEIEYSEDNINVLLKILSEEI